jgi:hypothetical protein
VHTSINKLPNAVIVFGQNVCMNLTSLFCVNFRHLVRRLHKNYFAHHVTISTGLDLKMYCYNNERETMAELVSCLCSMWKCLNRFFHLQVSATHVGKRWQERGRLAKPWVICTTQTALSAAHVGERCVEKHFTMSMGVSTVRKIIW